MPVDWPLRHKTWTGTQTAVKKDSDIKTQTRSETTFNFRICHSKTQRVVVPKTLLQRPWPHMSDEQHKLGVAAYEYIEFDKAQSDVSREWLNQKTNSNIRFMKGQLTCFNQLSRILSRIYIQASSSFVA